MGFPNFNEFKVSQSSKLYPWQMLSISCFVNEVNEKLDT